MQTNRETGGLFIPDEELLSPQQRRKEEIKEKKRIEWGETLIIDLVVILGVTVNFASTILILIGYGALGDYKRNLCFKQLYPLVYLEIFIVSRSCFG